MKILSKFLVAVLFFLSCTTTFAQNTDTRPKLYSTLPSVIDIDKLSLDNMLQNNVGAKISMPLSTIFNFKGTVFSNTLKYNNMQTVLLRSDDDKESIFQITKVNTGDNTYTYTGRILNPNVADGYEIKSKNGDYYLQKFETSKIMEPCKF